ncbi:hypothetical protein DPMN_168813 [Dreissena polymorpha]|uniref:Uncharacterized protein n=1 Tax=Dreissena polymorpha TaxID=45954 RepID=A0A9D4IZQ0_DREPO|nr:hypothetical protein DPMN_168813 [Dreissena polymorpha]
MNPCPKVITGHLHQQNKGAFDWGFQGFLAYGCQCYTVIVDPKSLQVIQTVGPQNGFVNYVRWAEEDYHHMFATGSTYTLHVASADTSGTYWRTNTTRFPRVKHSSDATSNGGLPVAVCSAWQPAAQAHFPRWRP